jgi:hypothetical protein
MVRGPRRPGVPRPPEPMRPKPPGLQPPRFTLVVQRCRRVRYRWRQWAWIPLLAPAIRWLRRSQTAAAAFAVAGPMAVAVWYLPIAQGPPSASAAPGGVSATAGRHVSPAAHTDLSSGAPGPATPEGSGALPALASAPTSGQPGASHGATAASELGKASGVRSLAPRLTNLLQNGLTQLPSVSLPQVTLPSVAGLPAVTLPAVALPVSSLPQLSLPPVTLPPVTLPPVTVPPLVAALPPVLSPPPHP